MQEETWSEFGGSVVNGSECRGSVTVTWASDQAAVEARDQDLIRFMVWGLGFRLQASGFRLQDKTRLLLRQGGQDLITAL
jgi:hypothetical protein